MGTKGNVVTGLPTRLRPRPSGRGKKCAKGWSMASHQPCTRDPTQVAQAFSRTTDSPSSSNASPSTEMTAPKRPLIGVRPLSAFPRRSIGGIRTKVDRSRRGPRISVLSDDFEHSILEAILSADYADVRSRHRGHLLLQHRELSGLNGRVKDKNRVEDDPPDGEQSESRAITGGGHGQLGRHPINENGHGQSHQQAGERRDLRADMPERQQTQERDDRERLPTP